jgi:hypothetical protein
VLLVFEKYGCTTRVEDLGVEELDEIMNGGPPC